MHVVGDQKAECLAIRFMPTTGRGSFVLDHGCWSWPLQGRLISQGLTRFACCRQSWLIISLIANNWR